MSGLQILKKLKTIKASLRMYTNTYIKFGQIGEDRVNGLVDLSWIARYTYTAAVMSRKIHRCKYCSITQHTDFQDHAYSRII